MKYERFESLFTRYMREDVRAELQASILTIYNEVNTDNTTDADVERYREAFNIGRLFGRGEGAQQFIDAFGKKAFKKRVRKKSPGKK